MTFFYDLNKRLAAVNDKPETQQLNERDMSRAAKAGRDGKSLDPVRNKYDKYDNKEVDEGLGNVVKKVGGMVKKVGGAVLNKLGHGDDADMIRDLQRKMGVPQTGKKPQTMAFHKSNTVDDNAVVAKEEYGPMEAGAPMTAKQKSFAKLAPPADKITFADKIAGAKKEVDEMLGDVAAEAMKSALSGKKKTLDKNNNDRLDATDFAMLRKGGKKEVADEASQDNAFTAHKRPKEEPDMRQGERRKTHTGGEIEKTSDTSIRHHAGRNYSGDEEDADTKKADKADAMARRASGEKSKLGRKEGSKKRIGAKINTGTSKLMTKEGDNEGNGNLKAAMALLKKAGYTVSKAKAESEDDAPFDADPPKKNPSALAGKHGQGHSTAKHLAKQGMKNVSKDKEKEEVEETSDNAPSKSSGGVSYGKGIYDSMNRDVENAITESMAQLSESLSINMSSSTEGGKSLTVTATEEDAMKLAVLLKMSGLGGGQGMEQSNEACPSCGGSSCNCDQMDEAYGDTAETQNSPDYPTNTETGSSMQYSGGLDGPKTGQSTLTGGGIPNLDPSRQDSYADVEEDALHRMMEMAGIKEAKKPDFPDIDNDGNAMQYSGGLEEVSTELLTKARDAARDRQFGSEANSERRAEQIHRKQGDRLQAGINDRLKKQRDAAELASLSPAKQRLAGKLEEVSTGQSTVPVLASQEDRQATYAEDADLRRMMEMAGIQEAKKPDFLTKDGDKKEPMKKAIDDKDDKKVKESIFDLTNQWKAYKAQ